MSTVRPEASPERVDSRETSGGTIPVNRMGIVLLSLVGFFVSSYLLLFKLGVIGTLACGAGGCNTVQNSPWSVFLGVPVPAWGVAGYGLIFVLGLIGIQPGFVRDRRIGWALVGLSAVGFSFSLYLTGLEAFVIRAWCRWCVVSAVLATAIFGFSLVEMRRLGRAEYVER